MDIDRFFEWLSLVAWLIVVGVAILFFVINTRRRGIREAARRIFSTRLLLLITLAVILSILSASVVFIQPQEVGVVVSIVSAEGFRDQPLRSGLHLIFPFAESPVRYPISWQTYTMSSKPGETGPRFNDAIAARTSDGQEVSLDSSVIFRIDPEQAVRIHLEWQQRYIEDFVRPLVRGIIRREVSGFTVDEVNSSKRRDLEANLDRQLGTVLEDKGLILDQFVLRNIAFSPEYAASVEQKQVALQGKTQAEYEADQMRNRAAGEADKVRLQAQAQADARLIQAEAEARALTMLAESLAGNSDLLTYRYIDKLSPAIKVMLVPNNAPLILPAPYLEPDQTQVLSSTLDISETLVTVPAPPSPAE